MTLIAQLPLFIGASLTIVMMLGSAAMVYSLGRWLISQLPGKMLGAIESSDRELVLRIFGICATLMALILTFTFNSLRNDYTALRDSTQLEAAQVSDIAMDLDIFASTSSEQLHKRLAQYVRIVIDEEWPHLADGLGLHPKATQTFNDLQFGIHGLEAKTAAQISLRANLIADIDEISDYRQHRAFQALPEPPQFLSAALLGFMITIATLVLYEPSALRYIVVGFYSIFVGIVVYSMLILSSPFASPIALSPAPLIQAYSQMSQQ